MTAGAARLDAELVRRGLVRSRTRAARLLAEGRVAVDGEVVTKPSRPVGEDAEITVDAPATEYVSRAALKLAGALDSLAGAPGAPDPRGRWCLDAGASTGGFTQVLLERGAAHVHAVDVGHGQMDPALAGDPRVTCREGVNVRDLAPTGLPRLAELVVADLSFISLTLVVGPLVALCEPAGDLLLMVKPQFEVGRERLGSGGVVKSTDLRREAVLGVVEAARAHGASLRAVVPSPVPGPAGNHEYFVWLRPEPAEGRDALHVREAVRRAVVDGTTAVMVDELRGLPRRTA
ncbi:MULTISPECIES: TlyA family RNA methyltransferase [unclassified Actinotalea]|uniref:TlyA family RNA methyltransferase n=1 Tax=unclassified Actinotalea TaxID=2638618 RepID=UPI0015F60634|nr:MULTISPECIES: TlyA family RNA methyltransferase [unclassified Actinotalea]